MPSQDMTLRHRELKRSGISYETGDVALSQKEPHEFVTRLNLLAIRPARVILTSDA